MAVAQGHVFLEQIDLLVHLLLFVCLLVWVGLGYLFVCLCVCAFLCC